MLIPRKSCIVTFNGDIEARLLEVVQKSLMISLKFVIIRTCKYGVIHVEDVHGLSVKEYAFVCIRGHKSNLFYKFPL